MQAHLFICYSFGVHVFLVAGKGRIAHRRGMLMAALFARNSDLTLPCHVSLFCAAEAHSFRRKNLRFLRQFQIRVAVLTLMICRFANLACDFKG